MALEGDRSSGHMKGKEDGLKTEVMNCNWGGKQRVIRNSVLTVDCLGPEEQRGVIYVRGDAEESTTTMTEKRKLRVCDI